MAQYKCNGLSENKMKIQEYFHVQNDINYENYNAQYICRITSTHDTNRFNYFSNILLFTLAT